MNTFFSFLLLSVIFVSCAEKERKNTAFFRNVVVIIEDDRSYEVARCYGNEIIRPPNPDRLAFS